MGDFQSFTNVMNEYMKKQCPNWANDTMLEHDLILGDDSDSLLSCNLLDELTNGLWKVNYFYDFESVYRQKETKLPVIGVDMAFTKNVRTFDNHVTQQYYNSPKNPSSINPNIYYNITANDNYYKKYPFSTLMVIMAYYNIELPTSDTGKDLILAVDSAFKGHFTSNKHFKDIHTTWLQRMGFESLLDRLNANPSGYYYQLQQDYGLNEKININENGLLTSNIKFDDLQPFFDWKIGLPNKQFNLIKECKRSGQSIHKKLPSEDDLISLAYTGKEYVSFTQK